LWIGFVWLGVEAPYEHSIDLLGSIKQTQFLDSKFLNKDLFHGMIPQTSGSDGGECEDDFLQRCRIL
jgi:hypothetical protein